MKKIILVLSILFIISCEGSDSYQGKWKAVDPKGNKFDILFSPSIFSIKDGKGNFKTYKYTQNSIKSENSIETYGYILEDGRGYQVRFPMRDESAGLILDENGVQMFTISRKDYITYEELYKLD